MLRSFRLLATALPFTVAGGAAAHPGHGETGAGTSLAHHLAEPEHALFVLALLATLALGAGVYRRLRAVRSRHTRR
ncbi:MAG: hypothetical protein ACQGVC_13435 [Myxococcota bacterium]